MTERSGLSRRQALKYGGLAATAPLLAAMRPAGKTSPVNLQSNWRWCHRCQGLWFAGDGTGGVCPARGFHSLKGSGDYFLTQGSGSGQDNWRWCHRCQGLWFAGDGTGGVCPARGFHSLKGSGDYFLTQGSGSGQDNWRWCHRCQGLWFAGSGTGGVCPARGFHSLKGSGDYFLL